jgi:hypothetical protein
VSSLNGRVESSKTYLEMLDLNESQLEMSWMNAGYDLRSLMYSAFRQGLFPQRFMKWLTRNLEA